MDGFWSVEEIATRRKATVVAFGVVKSVGYLLGYAIYMLIVYDSIVGTVFGTFTFACMQIFAVCVLCGCVVDQELDDWRRARRKLRQKWINVIEEMYAGNIHAQYCDTSPRPAKSPKSSWPSLSLSENPSQSERLALWK